MNKKTILHKVARMTLATVLGVSLAAFPSVDVHAEEHEHEGHIEVSTTNTENDTINWYCTAEGCPVEGVSAESPKQYVFASVTGTYCGEGYYAKELWKDWDFSEFEEATGYSIPIKDVKVYRIENGKKKSYTSSYVDQIGKSVAEITLDEENHVIASFPIVIDLEDKPENAVRYGLVLKQDGSVVTSEGDPISGVSGLTYSADTKKWTMSGFSFSTYAPTAIYCEGDATIVLTGENSIQLIDSYAEVRYGVRTNKSYDSNNQVTSNGKLTFEGTGSFKVNLDQHTVDYIQREYGIYTSGDLTNDSSRVAVILEDSGKEVNGIYSEAGIVNHGDMSVQTRDASSSIAGIDASGSIENGSGTISVKTGSSKKSTIQGVKASGSITNEGDITVEVGDASSSIAGIDASGSIENGSGTISVKTGSSSESNIKGVNALSESITNEGDITVEVGDASSSIAGINASGSIENGSGTISVKTGSSSDSNIQGVNASSGSITNEGDITVEVGDASSCIAGINASGSIENGSGTISVKTGSSSDSTIQGVNALSGSITNEGDITVEVGDASTDIAGFCAGQSITNGSGTISVKTGSSSKSNIQGVNALSGSITNKGDITVEVGDANYDIAGFCAGQSITNGSGTISVKTGSSSKSNIQGVKALSGSITNKGDITVKVGDANYDIAGIYASESIENGSGTIRVTTGSSSNSENKGIRSGDDIMNRGILAVKVAAGNPCYGIDCYNNLETYGSITVIAGEGEEGNYAGINLFKKFTIHDGGSVNITGGTNKEKKDEIALKMGSYSSSLLLEGSGTLTADGTLKSQNKSCFASLYATNAVLDETTGSLKLAAGADAFSVSKPILFIAKRSLRMGSDLTMVYKTVVPQGYTDPYLVVKIQNSETKKWTEVTIRESTTDGFGRTCFNFTGINPQRMQDQIKVVLHAKNGEQEEVSTENVISVCEYAKLVLENEAYADYHNLMKALLNYGAEAQKLKKYNTAQLATGTYDCSQTDHTASWTKVENLNPVKGGVKIEKKSAVFDNSVRIIVKFSLEEGTSLEDVSFKFKLGGNETTISDFEEVSAGIYAVTTPEINATEFDNTVTFTAYVNEEADDVLEYSVNDYLLAAIEKNYNVSFMKAVFEYGYACEKLGQSN